MKIILFGCPGAGKGTQGAAIAHRLNIPTVSTGNIIREAISSGSALGVEFRKYTDAGRLVPDALVISMLKERIARPDCAEGYILDGFPRTLPQAAALEEMGIAIDTVLNIEVPDSVILERMTGRRVCPKCGETYHIRFNPPPQDNICGVCGAALVQRADDNADTVSERLRIYHQQTEPCKAYYDKKKLLVTVDGTQTPAAVTVSIFQALGI